MPPVLKGADKLIRSERDMIMSGLNIVMHLGLYLRLELHVLISQYWCLCMVIYEKMITKDSGITIPVSMYAIKSVTEVTLFL